MLKEQWLADRTNDQPRYFEVCTLAPELVAHLGATTATVFISRAYLDKILKKHNISLGDLPIIKMAIDRGIAISDKDKHLTFFYESASKQHFKATIKATGNLDEIFLCTFHKIRLEEVERKLRQLADKRLFRLYK